jgi:transposase-like protein
VSNQSTLAEFTSATDTDGSESDTNRDEKLHRDEEWLREQYHGEDRSTTEIADELGVSVSTICNWLDKHGIDTKSNLEAQVGSASDLLKDAEWLRTEYCENERSSSEIGDELGVSGLTVRNWLEKHGIDRRSQSEARAGGNVEPLHDSDWLYEQYIEQERSTYDIADELGVNRNTVSSWLDRHDIEKRGDTDAFGKKAVDELKDRDWLYQQYGERERSTYDIADELNVVKTTVCEWMRRHDIEFRSPSQRVSDGDITPLTDEKWLREQYEEKQRSKTDIAEELNLSVTAVSSWIQKHEIDARSVSESRAEGDTKPLHDSDWLYEQYIEQERSTYDIADELDIDRTTVSNWLGKHGIETRGDTEAFGAEPVEELQNAEWLYQQYHERGKSCPEIASRLDVAASTVRSWMHKHDIEFRSHSESLTTGNIDSLQDADWLREQYKENQRTKTDIAHELDVSIGSVGTWLKKHGIEQRSLSEENSEGDVGQLHDPDWLYAQYVEQERTTTDIAEELGVATGTVSNWIKKHGFELRTVSESKADGNVTPLHDLGWLQTEYAEEGRTTEDIAEELGVAPQTVYQWLNRHGIKLRAGLQYPDDLTHPVRSDWELTIAELLVKEGVDYEYESLKITYDDGRVYTPDFVTDRYVIEVKGYVYEDRDEKRRAKAAMEQLDDHEYVVVGTELPADHHFSWDERDEISTLFE